MKNTIAERYAGLFPPERQRKLQSIYRYSMFEVMFYRPNLWLHGHRVSWIIEELNSIAKKIFKNYDPEKAALIGFVHDDAEMITGDIQAGHKIHMTKKQLRAVALNETRAIGELARNKAYPEKIGKYKYKDLLLDALYHRSVESQISDYADKLDSYCESLHDVLAGNITLLRSVIFRKRF